eukprot:gb/GECH01007879.1/.p1 GENE.gb/GECH01007879.1/~~gb/GECH01007879.1/.p1  ORF type:complete len:444 (+),score=122.82 gb/GECH01007879.1/:1-1332(+)
MANESIVSSSVASSSGSFNFSLLQGGILTKIIVGGIVAGSVIVAAAVAGTVIGTRAESSPPVTYPDMDTTFKNVPISLNPTSNDIAIERDNVVDPALISLDSVSPPKHGVISFDAITKNVTYTPHQGWIGSDDFTYTISNDKRSVEGTINITTINRPPNPIEDKFDVSKNTETQLDVLRNDEDQDGDTLTIVQVTQPEKGKGSVSSSGDSLIFTANEGESGSDTFRYTVTDQNTTASTHVIVKIINDPPIARSETYRVPMNSGVNVFNILANDEDPNGDPISVVQVSEPSHGKYQQGDSFTGSLSSGVNRLRYVPDFGYYGSDRFDYTLTDGTVSVNEQPSAIVEIQVENNPPSVQNISLTQAKGPEEILFDLNNAISDPNPYSNLEVSVSNNELGTVNLRPTTEEKEVVYQGETHVYKTTSYNPVYKPAFDEDGYPMSYSET